MGSLEVRSIEGYPNYSISAEGVICNISTGRIKSTYTSKRGYTTVGLSYRNKYKLFTLHRLLALHFIPNPENKPQVNHIDGNKLNNKLSNLEWVTNKENTKHAHVNGLCPRTDSQNKNCHKSAVKHYWKHPTYGLVYASVPELVYKYELQYSHLYEVLKGKRKSSKKWRVNEL